MINSSRRNHMSSWDGIFIFHVRYMYLIIVIANIYYMKNMIHM